jgi:uncharacterized SAM-binding protein YcdF (DUF218 family)
MLSLALLLAAAILVRLAMRSNPAAPRVRRWILLGMALWAVAGAAALAPGQYELRKFFGVCLMPGGLVWLALLAATWWAIEKPHWRMALGCGALALVYTLAGNAWLGGALLERLSRPYHAGATVAVGQFDAVAVLGGGVDVWEDGRPMLTAVGDRAVAAARLLRTGSTRVLVTAGPFITLPDGRRVSAAAATAAVWRDLGLPADRIATIDGPRTTAEELRALRRLAEREGWHRIGLLTSAWHLRRVMFLAGNAGLQAEPIAAGPVERFPLQLRWLVPQEAGFRQIQIACWELLGYLRGN